MNKNNQPMSKFDQYSESFNSSTSGGSSKIFTGLTAAKVLAINPTTAQLKEIIGDGAEKFNVDYKVEDNSILEIQTRPLVMWLQDAGEKVSPFIFQTNISKDSKPSKNGNCKIINLKLQDTWGASVDAVADNPKMGWFSQTGARVARFGEFEYYKFLATLLGFDFSNEEINFFEMCQDLGIDFDTVLKGNYEGLHELVKYVNNENSPKYIGLPFAAKQKQDGTYKQDIIYNTDLMYRTSGKITERQIINFEEKAADQENAGYPYGGTREFTYHFQEFNPETKENASVVESIDDSSDLDGWLD